MADKKISVAIISDLHCHHSSSAKYDSYLTTDLLRTAKDHPVESIIQLIESENIKTNLTLCPGDFTNRSDKQGFHSGWGFTLEIHNKLGSQEILATLGNHDVDSYGEKSDDPFEIAKGIKRGFPIRDSEKCDIFWSRGGVFIEKEEYRVLVINSSHFHYNKTTSKSGKIDDNLLSYIDTYLKDNKENKICIALAHHHPIDHSRLDLGDEDKILNADDLLEVLGHHKFDLFVHGHKHDPLLRYHNCHGNNHRIPILSSGSFSATTNHSWTSQRNTFHVIELTKEGSEPANGRIVSWTFIRKNGWTMNYDKAGFPPYTGFGFKGELQELVDKIVNEVGTKPNKKWREIVSAIPAVNYLMPNEGEQLVKLLTENDLILSSKISENPEYICNVKSLG